MPALPKIDTRGPIQATTNAAPQNANVRIQTSLIPTRYASLTPRRLPPPKTSSSCAAPKPKITSPDTPGAYRGRLCKSRFEKTDSSAVNPITPLLSWKDYTIQVGSVEIKFLQDTHTTPTKSQWASLWVPRTPARRFHLRSQWGPGFRRILCRVSSLDRSHMLQTAITGIVYPLLHDPQALDRVTKETQGGVSHVDEIDSRLLTQLRVLNAAIKEKAFA
ncbi:hypothetical protein BJX96DRAFT_174199 [Aspergillus floccosus]